jgi:hypothetical protein
MWDPLAELLFAYYTHAGLQHTFGSRMETEPPMGAWGPTVDVFYVDDGRSRISGITSQVAHHRHLLR